jgi:hypothetical protein
VPPPACGLHGQRSLLGVNHYSQIEAFRLPPGAWSRVSGRARFWRLASSRWV